MDKYEYIAEDEGCVLYRLNGEKKLTKKEDMPKILNDSYFYQGETTWIDEDGNAHGRPSPRSRSWHF